MEVLTLNENSEMSSLTPLQKTFNQRTRKIAQLRGQVEAMKREYESAIAMYHSDVPYGLNLLRIVSLGR